jgi:hypothetical protein
MTCAPTATRTRDLPLRRSYRGRWPTAAFLVSCGLPGAWHPVSVPGFRLVRAREGHGRGSSSPWCSTSLGYEASDIGLRMACAWQWRLVIRSLVSDVRLVRFGLSAQVRVHRDSGEHAEIRCQLTSL